MKLLSYFELIATITATRSKKTGIHAYLGRYLIEIRHNFLTAIILLLVLLFNNINLVASQEANNMKPIQKKSIKLLGDRKDNYIKIFLKRIKKNSINLHDIEKYFHHLKNNNSIRNRSYNNSTISTYIYAIASKLKRTLHALGRRADITDLMYFIKDLRIGNKDKNLVQFVPEKKEITTIIKKSDLKTSLLIRAFYYTGCRLTELLNVELNQVTKFKKDAGILILGKGKILRFVFIPWKLFLQIKKEYNSKKYLFENLNGSRLGVRHTQRKISNASIKHTQKNIHTHLLRRGFANHVYKSNPHLKDLADYMGNSPQTLAKYYLKGNLTSKKIYQTLLTKEDKERYL